MMYKLLLGVYSNIPVCIQILSDGACIPFDQANTDYQQFKKAINDDTAQLEDADGVIMTAADAKAFVATLP